MSRRIELPTVLLLASLVATSGTWAVASKHESRRLFAEIEGLKREQDRLQVDWRQLQLEQSTLGAHARVETIAREQLELADPLPQQLRIVTEREP